MISQLTSLLQICGMAFVVLGDSLLETFGLSPANTPKWLASVKENKIGVVSRGCGDTLPFKSTRLRSDAMHARFAQLF